MATTRGDGDGWLRGKGWLDARWPDGPPTAAALDTVTGDRPAALWAHDHHTLWVNSAALRAVGVDHANGVLHGVGGVAVSAASGQPHSSARRRCATA